MKEIACSAGRRGEPTRGRALRCTSLLIVAAVPLVVCLSCVTASRCADLAYCLRVIDDPVPEGFGVRQGIPYHCRGGTMLCMDIFYPSSGPPTDGYPLVMHLHGGGWRSGARSTGGGAREIAALAQAGFAVASIDYRLAPEASYPAPVQDLRAALRFLDAAADDFSLSRGSVVLMGTSAGAHVALCYALGSDRDGWTVAAVVDFFGPVDPVNLLRGVRGRFSGPAFGVRSAGDPQLEQWNLTRHVSPVAPPTLVVHGDRDTVVPLEQSLALRDAYLAVGADLELLVVSGAGHAFRPVNGRISPAREWITRRVVEFVAAQLRPASSSP